MKRTVLVIGGAGYIGSHLVKRLCREGHAVVTFDNLSTGHRDAIVGGEFIEADLLDSLALGRIFAHRRFDVVMHCAASCYVGESVTDPHKYYRNNVAGTLNLLEAMLEHDAPRLVFSSSCSTYGTPQTAPVSESHPQRPDSPYGRTKLVIENALADYGAGYGLQSVSLRYFNAAGSDPEGELGERHEPETHLIPLALEEALRVNLGGNPEDTTLRVYGEDFPTPDGSCVRDYVHVSDVCEAHLAAAARLIGGGTRGAEAYNIGLGRGYSVKEVIAACRRVTGADIRFELAARRPGDPSIAVADSSAARNVLGWAPKLTDLDGIVRTAWQHRLRRRELGEGRGTMLRIVDIAPTRTGADS